MLPKKSPMQTVQDLIENLELSPHPEGGYYKRTFQNKEGPKGRGHATAIYYLLEGGSFNKWHKIDSDELWFWHAGATLTLETAHNDKGVQSHTLGPNVLAGELPQLLAPAHKWQRAKSNGDWTLVSCSVSPGFTFENYDLIEDPNWQPDTA
tara:strand:- start:2541 stop:2993 length:453 start_codon:yes stop_codon:yes gene_type:complete